MGIQMNGLLIINYKQCRDIKFITLIILVIVFLFISKAWAIAPQEVLTKMDVRLKGLKSYSVETVENGKTIGPRGLEESRGIGKVFVKESKRYSEITIVRSKSSGSDMDTAKSSDQEKKENKMIQVSDGTVSWFYEPEKKEVKKVDFTKLPAKIQEKIRSAQDATDLKLPEGLEFDLDEKKEGKKRFYVLTSQNTVTAGSQKYEKIILWIDAKEYLPLKVEMHGKIIVKIPQGSNLEIQTQVVQEYKNWDLNPDIPDSRFVFTVPEGVKVKDATEETGGIYERYMKSR